MTNTNNIKAAIRNALRACRIKASLEANGIEFDTSHGYVIRGNTYPVRAAIKAAGGFRWNGQFKCWANHSRYVYRDVSPTELGAAMLRELAR